MKEKIFMSGNTKKNNVRERSFGGNTLTDIRNMEILRNLVPAMRRMDKKTKLYIRTGCGNHLIREYVTYKTYTQELS